MKELAKQYDPSQVEDRIYQFWLDGTTFWFVMSDLPYVDDFEGK